MTDKLTVETSRRREVSHQNIDFRGRDSNWVALPDEAAREVITTAVEPFVMHGSFPEVEKRERALSTWLIGELGGLIEQWDGRGAELR